MKLLLQRSIFIGALLLATQSAFAQGIGTYNINLTGVGNQPSLSSQWANGSNPGKYWDFVYDACSGRVKVLMYLYENGSTSEVEELSWEIKENDNRVAFFQYSWDVFRNYDAWKSQTAPLTSTTTISYQTTGDISNLRFFDQGDRAYVEFEWALPTSGAYTNTYTNFSQVEWDEWGSNPTVDINYTFDFDPLSGSGLAPTTARTTVGNNEPAIKVDFAVQEACSGSFDSNKGPFYRVKRYKDNVYEKTFNNVRYPTTTSTQTFIDSGSGFDPCANYSYSIESIVINSRGTLLQGESPKSSAFSHSTILAQPDNITASQNSCDGAVTINWTWSNATPEGFSIERKLPGESIFTQIQEVAGTLRSYVDNIPDNYQSQNIKYRVRTKSICGLSAEQGLSEVTGVAPAPLEVPTGVTISIVESGESKFIRLGWDDNSSSESKYIITRTFQTGGGLVTYELAANTTSFDDLNVSICQPYKYQVKVASDCAPNGIYDADEEVEIVIDADISNVISENSLIASRGYYADRVTLNWAVGGISDNISRYRIFSRPLGSDEEPVLVGVTSGAERSYEDSKAEPGQILEYFLIGEADCGETILKTNDTQQISLSTTGVSTATGFRSPTGVINGNIAYAGGNGVGGVKVIVETDNGNKGYALSFDGNDAVTIADTQAKLSPEKMSLGFYIKPDLPSLPGGGSVIFEKQNAYKLSVGQNGKLTFSLYISGNYVDLESSGALSGTDYQQVYATFDGTEMKLYLDGELDNTKAQTGSIDINNTQALVVGSLFHGLIDEISLWSLAKTANAIKQDHVRLLNRNETGLIGYWPVSVGIGTQIFDASKTGNKFNGHDGTVTGAAWSETIPESNQLSTIAYTNAQGNYTVSGIPFNGEGQNFKVTPVYGVHEFSPQEKFIYIGLGNLVQNGVDFEDISSFTVTGSVVFDYNNVKTGSQGVRLLVDGQPIFDSNGNLIQTDASGQFSIQVPIGEHYITVEKSDHTFDNAGRFPINTSQRFNFNEPLSGLEFIDNTRRKLVGKVVGGTREGNKPVGFDRTVNNIGQARFLLVSSNQAISTDVTTDLETGEFEVSLPPLLYNFKQPITEDIGKALKVSENTTISLPKKQIDLSSNYNPTYDTDTVAFADNVPLKAGTVRIDTVDNNTREVRKFDYDYKVNQVLRTVPQVEVFDGSSSTEQPFLGIDEFPVKVGEEVVKVPLRDNANNSILGYPVIITDNDYKLKIKVSEKYINTDSGSPVEDLVPVTDAKITIDNNMMKAFYLNNERKPVLYSEDLSKPEIQLVSHDGDTVITFKALTPEFNENSDPSLSYTKNFKVTVLAGGNVVNWPNPNNQNEVQRLYVFGSEPSENTSFVTSGPKIVDHIIRDPYGGESYAYLEKGTTLTITKSFSYNKSDDLGIDGGVTFGSDKNNFGITGGFSVSTNLDSAGTTTTEITTTESFQTRSDAQEVGAGGDLYISSSNNYKSGFAKTLRMVLAESCGSNGIITCLDDSPTITVEGRDYKLARTFSSFLQPDGNPTYFVYSQNHIVNTLIPDLKNARNSVLATDDRYVSKLPDTDPNYGINNDDKVWNLVGNDPEDYAFEEDSDGPSYKFTPNSVTEKDTVAWINQQIRLWEQAIERNEIEKALTLTRDDFENYSITGGATLTKEISSSKSDSYEITYSTSSAFSIGTVLNADILGVAVNVTTNASFTESRSSSYSSETVASTTFGYVLSEPDVGDFVSMNVYPGSNGNGPIFILTGGETSCPHEEAVTTLFYNPGMEIGATTFQRDKPRLDVAVSEIYNVPADNQAAFNLTLYNDSESNDGFLYALQVIDESNPDGAVMKMDGEFFDSRRQIFVPGGGAINKTITVQRGPFEYDYKDIKVVMASICQSDPTDFEKIIADTVSISAYFLPICTTPEIVSPDNNWTINNRFENKMSVEIGDFDINFPGFEYLELQYKSSESSAWIPVQRFYRDLQVSGNPANGIQIPRTGATFSYQWDVSQILDGNYDLRVVSDCEVLSTRGRVKDESSIKSGIIDRINPHLFGSPQPGDGILSPGDEISIQFNEPINTALLSPSNFSIRGVLNGGALNHNVSLSFDGTDNSYVELVNPPNIKSRDFSIDFWAKRNSSGEEVLIHQGASKSQMLQIGFDDTDALYFEMNDNRLITKIKVTHQNWAHYTLAYDFNNEKVMVTVASGANTETDEATNFTEEYQVNEPMLIGKSKVGNSNPFNGNLHELRIWSKILSETEVAVNRNKLMTASTSGLLANWPFNEARGNIGLDIVKVRQAKLNTGWKLDPSGASMAFNGTSQYLESNGIGSFNAEQNFTIEFWFKTASSANMTMFSNGKGDGTDDNENGWSVNLEDGKIVIENNGESITSAGLNLADNQWHQLALAVNRVTNTQLFIDGELNASVSSDLFSGFANDKFYFGRRSWKENNILQSDQYFSGLIDEFRLWRTNRSQSEIELNQFNKLNGDELGLVLYYPFEAYITQAGILVSQNNNASGVAEAGSEADFTNNAAYNTDVPAIRLPRPLSAVSFNHSANADKIILTTNEDNARLENVILTVGVKNIKDLNGNVLDAPLTWTAYVDRNDVVWLEDDMSFKKPVNEAYSFTTQIVNNGGLRRTFNISNLPFWLSASPSSGVIEPTKSKTITFTVNEGLNIGEYNEFIHLTTDFGFDEKLNIELSVFKAPPADWIVNSSKFQSSMSVVAQIKINDIFSRDTNDLIAAFVDGQCRGVAPLKYFQSFDNYQAFLSVYTDVTSSENVTYKIWDASEGKIYAGIEVSEANVNVLSPDAYYGSPASPVVYSAGNFLEQNLNVAKGWQWISFNLNSTDLTDVNTVLAGYNAEENDQIKSLQYFDQYDPVNGWIGTLSANGGIRNEEMYKINASNEGMLSYSGSIIDAPTTPIDLNAGWNWIGFYGQQNQDINEALSNLSNLNIGDRIKGQRDFAVYGGQGVGWVGSLQSLKPGEGYMYLAQSAGKLTYPEVSRRVSGASSRAEYGWTSQGLSMDQFNIEPGRYEFNMSFILEVQADREIDDQSAVLVKSNGEYVGFGQAIHRGAQQVYFVTIFGEQTEEISFELIENGILSKIESAVGQNFSFRKNENVGTLETPEPFLLKEQEVMGEITATVVPNPFETSFRVDWSENSAPNKLLLTTSRGEVLEVVQQPGGKSYSFNLGTAPNGVYLVQLQFEEGLKVVKAIKAN